MGPWREASHAYVLSSVRYTGAHHFCPPTKTSAELVVARAMYELAMYELLY
jgi:hypothetical protein